MLIMSSGLSAVGELLKATPPYLICASIAAVTLRYPHLLRQKKSRAAEEYAALQEGFFTVQAPHEALLRLLRCMESILKKKNMLKALKGLTECLEDPDFLESDLIKELLNLIDENETLHSLCEKTKKEMESAQRIIRIKDDKTKGLSGQLKHVQQEINALKANVTAKDKGHDQALAALASEHAQALAKAHAETSRLQQKHDGLGAEFQLLAAAHGNNVDEFKIVKRRSETLAQNLESKNAEVAHLKAECSSFKLIIQAKERKCQDLEAKDAEIERLKAEISNLKRVAQKKDDQYNNVLRCMETVSTAVLKTEPYLDGKYEEIEIASLYAKPSASVTLPQATTGPKAGANPHLDDATVGTSDNNILAIQDSAESTASNDTTQEVALAKTSETDEHDKTLHQCLHEDCLQTFRSREDFEVHIQECNKDRPHMCYRCKMQFEKGPTEESARQAQNDLNRHVNSTCPFRLVLCTNTGCGEQFILSDPRLETHMETCHNYRFQCYTLGCGEIFRSINDFQTHAKTCSEDLREKNAKTQCNFIDKNWGIWNAHCTTCIGKHQRVWWCRECYKECFPRDASDGAFEKHRSKCLKHQNERRKIIREFIANGPPWKPRKTDKGVTASSSSSNLQRSSSTSNDSLRRLDDLSKAPAAPGAIKANSINSGPGKVHASGGLGLRPHDVAKGAGHHDVAAVLQKAIKE
jgi:hypothetical protein